MFSLFDDECTIISADNKAKVGIGIPAVSRYVDLSQKFFLSGSGPNLPDHAVNPTGNLIVPEGHLILTPKPKTTVNDVGPINDGDGNGDPGTDTRTGELEDSWSPPLSPTASEIEAFTLGVQHKDGCLPALEKSNHADHEN